MPKLKKQAEIPTLESTPYVRFDKKLGRFVWEINRPFDDESGRFRKAGSCTTLEQAIVKRDAALAELAAINAGKTEIKTKGITVEDFAKQCVETIWPDEIGERTVIGYDDILRLHVIPHIGAIRLPRLTYNHVVLIDSDLKAHGKSSQTRRNVRNCLSKLITTAQRVGMLDKDVANPAAMLIIKADVKRDELGNKITHKRTLTPLELKALLEKAKGTQYEGVVLLGLYAGLRIGEIVGLTWAHVNLQKKSIHVAQQRQYIRKKGIQVKDPKTAAGDRTIPIAAPLLVWLTKARENATQRYVIVDAKGNDPKADTITQWFKDLVTDAGLCGIKDEHGALLPDPTPHDLRHTFGHYMANGWAKKLDDAGNTVKRSPSVPITTLKSIMGHSSITVTAEYYVDTNTGDMRLAMSYIP